MLILSGNFKTPAPGMKVGIRIGPSRHCALSFCASMSETQCCCRAGSGPSLLPTPLNPFLRLPDLQAAAHLGTLGFSLRSGGRQLSLCKVTRRLALSLAEPWIPAWPWAHRICQQPATSTWLQPATSTWLQPTSPASFGHYPSHPPRPPGCKFSPSPHTMPMLS